MAETDIYAWRIPDLGEAPHGPNAIQELAEDVEATLADTTFQTYVPTFTGPGLPFNRGVGLASGRYQVWKGWCDLQVFISFGVGFSGGTDQLRLTLPLAGAPSANPSEQWMLCKLWTPSHGTWHGMIYVPTNSLVGYPYMSSSQTDVRSSVLRSADASGGAGTGTPLIPGGYPIQLNGHFTVNGRYRVI